MDVAAWPPGGSLTMATKQEWQVEAPAPSLGADGSNACRPAAKTGVYQGRARNGRLAIRGPRSGSKVCRDGLCGGCPACLARQGQEDDQ